MAALVAKVTKPWFALVAASQARLDRLEGPLKQHVDHHFSTGEDLTAKVFWEQYDYQQQLVKYRIDRVLAEAKWARAGGIALATTSYKDWIKFARFATHFFALFLLAVIVGRQSIYPLIPAGSPFVEQLDLMPPSRRAYIGY